VILFTQARIHFTQARILFIRLLVK